MALNRTQDPFAGLGASAVTSNIIDTRSAFDVTMSFRTTSGATSFWTYQLSNDTNRGERDIHENSWSDWTAKGNFARPSSGVSTIDPPLGYNFARLLRTSGASWQFYVSIQEDA